MFKNSKNNFLRNTHWSKDLYKKYKQFGHFLYNHKKYDLDVSDMIYAFHYNNHF